MINSLGSGYQFVGVAHPDTNPGTPDQRVFYLASSGTYPNFGPATIPAGNLAVLYYDTTWHYSLCEITAKFASGEEVNEVSIVNDPTIGGVHDVLSAEQGKELNLKNRDLEQTLSSINRNAFIELNHVISSSNWEYVASTSYDSGWVNILNNSTYLQVKNNTVSRITFYSDEHTINSTTKLESYTYPQDQKVNVPTNAKIAILTFPHSSNPGGYNNLVVTQSGMYVTEDELNLNGEELLNKIKYAANGFYIDFNHLFSVNYVTPSSSAYVENNSFDSLWIALESDYKKIYIDGAVTTRFVFFNSPNLVYENLVGHNIDGVVPTGAKFCCITLRKSDNPNGYDNTLVRFDYNIDEQLNPIKSSINQLDAVVSEHEVLTPDSVTPNSYINSDGTVNSSDNYEIWSFNVDETNLYCFSGMFPPSVTLYMIFFYNENTLLDKIIMGSSTVTYVKDLALDLPENTTTVKVNVRKSMISEFNLSLVGDYFSFQKDLERFSQQAPRGFFIDYNHIASLSGSNVTYLESSDFDSLWISIDSSYKKIILDNVTIVRYLWFSKPEINSTNYLGNNITGVVLDGAKFCCVTLRKSDNPNGYANLMCRWELDLDDYVKREELDEVASKAMKIIKSDVYCDIRTSLSDDNDILIRMWESATGKNMTFLEYYVGGKTLTDEQLRNNSYKVGSIGDMVGAMGVSSFWYLYAQHGWTIPRMTVASQTLDSSDIGSTWVDENDRQFVVGKVEGNYIYWLPVISQNTITGVYSSSWEGDLPYPTTLTHISGGVHTSSISGTSSRYDLVIQSVENRQLLADSLLITEDGIYYCNEFKIVENIKGYSVGDVSQWFPTPVYGDSLIDFDRTFTFIGSSCTCNTVINTINPFVVSDFRGCIPQMPLQFGNYHSFTLIPKVKKEVNGHRVDLPFDSDDGTTGANAISVSRTASDLYNVDDQPERCISYLKDNSNNYLVGMAGGCSLVRGITVAEKRNLYNPSGGCCSYGGSTLNKFYPILLRSSGFVNGIIDDTFIDELSCYYCWFDPNTNEGQVYWYKDGSKYIVYVHNQQSHAKLAVNLPSFMNGLVVGEVVEKTNGASLLTNQVVSNRLYVGFDTSSNVANYIVFTLD
jgi:hypothetical protein